MDVTIAPPEREVETRTRLGLKSCASPPFAYSRPLLPGIVADRTRKGSFVGPVSQFAQTLQKNRPGTKPRASLKFAPGRPPTSNGTERCQAAGSVASSGSI